jgi:tetratricopeptide (TPR) repeat protein
MKEEKSSHWLNKRRIITITVIVIIFISVWSYKPYYFKSDPLELMYIGIYYLSNDKYDDAVRTFKKATEHKESSELYYYYARSLFESGQVEKTLEKIEKSIALNPNNGDAYIVLGDYYYANNNKENAEMYYKKGLKLKPSSYAFYKAGKFYYLEGKTDDAFEYLSKSKDLNPENLELYPYLAEVYTKKGLFVSAFDIYEYYLNAKSMKGIPYSFLLTEEAEQIRKKLRLLRDMAGEA